MHSGRWLAALPAYSTKLKKKKNVTDKQILFLKNCPISKITCPDQKKTQILQYTLYRAILDNVKKIDQENGTCSFCWTFFVKKNCSIQMSQFASLPLASHQTQCNTSPFWGVGGLAAFGLLVRPLGLLSLSPLSSLASTIE